mmetsp:Transcript_19613/g.32371  ORF Transcript_19613/g.32371 Transcript_19613/m.32371 type:complete len:2656 (+) Transcript_19613:93-8060(+)
MEPAKIADYPVGTRCDVLDKNKWRTAKVIQVDEEEDRVRIHYEGWDSQYDEWVYMRLGAKKITPLWTMVEKGDYTGEGRNKPIGYELDIEEYKKEKDTLDTVRKALHDGTELKEGQMTWLCKGNYLPNMLQAIINEENWKYPLTFLTAWLETLVAALKSGNVTREQEKEAMKGIEYIFPANNRSIESPQMMYFRSINDVLGGMQKQVEGRFSSVTRNIEGEGPPEDLFATIYLLNKFGEAGGFDALRQRLALTTEDFVEGRKGKAQKGPLFETTNRMIATLRWRKYSLNENFMQKYFESLHVDDSNFLGGVLGSLDRNQIYAIAGKEKRFFDNFVEQLCSILRGAGLHRGAADEFGETAQLDLILFFIGSDKIVAQRRGMSLINLYIKALTPLKWEIGERVLAQFKNGSFYPGEITSINSDGTYNVHFTDGSGDTQDYLQAHCIKALKDEYSYPNEVEEEPPTLRFLNTERFIQWIEKNKVVDVISNDPRLFLVSSPIFKFLAKNKQLSTAHLDILLAQAKTEEGSALMSQLAEQMDEKTLTMMYKRQTEGIEFSEFTSWQLEALTKFTLSAVKATKGTHWYGLNLLWDMLAPENESKIEKSILQKATKCLNHLFENEMFASKRDEYAQMCVKSLTNGSGEVNALTIFQILMRGADYKETSQKIDENVENFDLLNLFFKNSKNYNAAAWKGLTEKKDGEKSPELRALSGVSTHKKQVLARLRFIQFICVHSPNRTLESAEIDDIWDLYTSNRVCEFDTLYFMKWLTDCLKEKKDGYPVFSPKSRKHLFTKLASKYIHKKTKEEIKVTPEWQGCFTACFLSSNREKGALEEAPLTVMKHSELEGMDQLWDFSLRESDSTVRANSQKFLGSMYIKFATMEMDEKSKLAALDEFVENCIKCLNEAKKEKDVALMQATLELMLNVLTRIDQGEMIKRPLYKKGEKIYAHWKRDGGTLYGAEIKGVNEDGTYWVHYDDGDVDKAAKEDYLRDKNKERRKPQKVELSGVEKHLKNTFAGEKTYFNLIFSFLDVGGVVGGLAWDTLEHLPASDTVAVRLCGIHKAGKIDWAEILPSRPVKLLYTLQIIDPAKRGTDKKSPLNNDEWCKTFVSGGLPRLASVLKESSALLVADKLALRCLSMMQKIFAFFTMGIVVSREVVLKVLPLDSIVDVSLHMIPNLVKTDEATVVDTSQALSSIFWLLTTAVKVQPSVFAQIKAFGPEWEKLVPAALIVNKNVMLQKAFTDGVDQLSKSCSEDSEQVSKLREQMRDKLLEVVHARFSELNTQNNCAQYLLLMRNLIANTNEIEEKSATMIGGSLANLIKKHPMTETTPKSQDAVLGALLNLTAELVKKVPDLRKEMGVGGKLELLTPVFDMLFKVPTLENSYHLKIRPPMCKHNVTREAAFRLLSALTSGNDDNLKTLAALLVPQHLRIYNKRRDNWEYEAGWIKDSDEREGYCGLINCGNTCYINAALQQIFMQPKLRENILAITNYQHPNPSRPQWKRDELQGLQWLLGHLQESTKRAIRPMKFHESFEDPDWENAGRPVRGEGAAGHEQADSNGFLQILLGRLEDRVKKGPYEDSVKTVCGLKFVDQIVGSRAAPYLNYEYSIDNWTGPISLNVNGHKTLHECLKSHVEFKQQQRKVSKEGVFGQKYEKKNVKVFKRTVFKTMPQCLMICLNRMGYDNMGNTLKLNHRISFPKKLNMKPYSAEVLNGKLPRGTDTGEAESSKADAKITPPSKHPDEYYQYELMGVIVHSGRTLQSGHYYSYIRERPPNDKWYCFNDSMISAFDVNKLEEETFGSADNDSWKCSTAYVLFYDKVEQPKEVVQKPVSLGLSKLKFAQAGKLVQKLQKKKAEAAERAKAKAIVPQGMLRKIWEENEEKWRGSMAHDRHYGVALRDIIRAFKEAHPKAPEQQPKVEDVSNTPSNLYDQITRLATRYLLMTLARSAHKVGRGWAGWVREVKALYVGNVASSVWLLSMFINPKVDWFLNILMAEYETAQVTYPVQEVRQGAVDLLAEAMRTLAAGERRAIAKACTAPAKRRAVRSNTPNRLGGMDQEAKKGDDGKDEKTDSKADSGSASSVANKIKEIVPRPNEGYLFTIIARLEYELRVVGCPSNYHWIRLLYKFAAMGPEMERLLVHYQLIEALVALVGPNQERNNADFRIDHLPDEYFSLLVMLCKTDEDLDLMKKPAFYHRLLMEGYTKARAAPISTLICKICNSDKEILDDILEDIYRDILHRHHELTRPFYRVLTALLTDKSAPDLSDRAPKIIGKLCLAFTQDLKFKEGDFLVEQILRLAKLSPACQNFLHNAGAAVERLIGFFGVGEKKETTVEWSVGDQVVARYKSESGVYPGEITVDHGDGYYQINYHDGDVWERAPAQSIRKRLHPLLREYNGRGRSGYDWHLDQEGLHPKTVKALQFYLRYILRRTTVELPEITGQLDSVTVAALQEHMRVHFRNLPVTGKLDEATIECLQRTLTTNNNKQNINLSDESGELGPQTKQHLREWLDNEVTAFSKDLAKRYFAGKLKSHEAMREELGFHKKYRRYTLTCEYVPYYRPVKEKVSALKKLLNKEPLDGGLHTPYDSEDEREERKFAVNQKVDVYDLRWKVGVVVRTSSADGTVSVKVDKTGRPGTKTITMSRSDPALEVEAGKYSSLKATNFV